MSQPIAIIIGAGPAGLTAAYELIEHTTIKPVIYEASDGVGGISRTFSYHGNRIDLGGHRFFSKSDKVMQWWLNILPLEPQLDDPELTLTYRNRFTTLAADQPPGTGANPDEVMLVRQRLSRIYYLRRFFPYPVSLNWATISGLGLVRMIRIGLSYLKSMLFPIRPETSLQDFFINRFGKELYLTFFKDYTEKVWGVPCTELTAEWGSQRVKGLSVAKALLNAVKSLVRRDSSLAQKDKETSLIERFLYPKFGPGQMWEKVATLVTAKGGELHLQHRVTGLHRQESGIDTVVVTRSDGTSLSRHADYVFSTMPISELITAINPPAPPAVVQVAAGLEYRDFITVGLLLQQLSIKGDTGGLISDNWIYIQEHDVKVGRIQVFNNWSPYLVADPGKVWLGLEYFCNQGDELWCKSDEEMVAFAVSELEQIGFARAADFSDGVVIRMPKTYPAYTGSYGRLDVVREFTDALANLFLLGRNGMHKYNNQDHSMLTAMTAVSNIVNAVATKDNIWQINTEEDYHEEK